jgi:hypothetical protein
MRLSTVSMARAAQQFQAGEDSFYRSNNPLGVGVIPFYRWYPDKGDDFGG